MQSVPQSAIHSFFDQVKNNPDRPALHVRNTFYTYRELGMLVTSIRRKMVEEGFAGEKVVGVLTNDDVHTYASLLAIQANGGAYVPLNDKNPIDRNREIIQDTQMRLILASEQHAALDITDQDFSLIKTQDIPSGDSIDFNVNAQLDELAYILFTSGSTGKPKGVPIHHFNLNAYLNRMLDKKAYDFSENDRFLQMFELTFDMSVSSFFIPMSIGACCYIVPHKGIAYMNIVNHIETHEITVVQLVPSVLSYIERFFDELHFPWVRYCIFAGEGLPVSVLPGWQKVIPNGLISNLYGPTEGTVVCFRYDWSDNVPKEDVFNGILSIGKPFSDCEFLVVNEQLEIVDPLQQKGELLLHGPQMTDHYWNNLEKTDSTFIHLNIDGEQKSYYRTGDLAFMNSNNNLMYCGRMDHQVKIDGHRIELGEIEHHLREIVKTPLAATIVKFDSTSNQQALHAFIENKHQLDESVISDYLNSKLPPYMIPKSIRFLDKMPINNSGKIDRKALEQLCSVVA